MEDLRDDDRKAVDAAIAKARVQERERCARHIELIAEDWRAADSYQKVYAAQYLASQIRDLQ